MSNCVLIMYIYIKWSDTAKRYVSCQQNFSRQLLRTKEQFQKHTCHPTNRFYYQRTSRVDSTVNSTYLVGSQER